MKQRWYPWLIAGCAMFTLFVTNGLLIGGLSVFDEKLLETFGWSRGALKFRDMLTLALAGLLGPLAGAIADRIGVRKMILFGATVLAVCFALYGRIESVYQLYAIHVVLSLVLVSSGLIVCVMLVSRWFSVRRGTAIGITLVGTSLGGVLLAPLGAALIEHFGWRRAFLIEASLPVLLLLVTALLIRDHPTELGLRALGADASSGPVEAGRPELTGMEYGAALRTRTFWALAFVAMLTFFCILGVSAHLFLHLRGLGVEPARAALGISMLFTFGLGGKFLIGLLADVLPHKQLFVGNLALMFLGSLFLASMQPAMLWPFLILFGLGWGGLYTLLQLLTVESFGLRASGKILGTITVLDAVGGGLGPWLIGLLYDRFGSYQVPFAFVALFVLLGTICGSFVRKEANQRQPLAGTEVQLSG